MKPKAFFVGLLFLCALIIGAQGSARERTTGRATAVEVGEARPIVFSTVYPAASEIYEIALDGNYIWLATVNGAMRWSKIDETVRAFTTRDGLAANHVHTILVEANGVKWFGTVNGLTRYDGLTWTTYTAAHGLPSSAVSAIYRHPNGSLLVGTSRGVAVFDGATFSRLPGDGVDSSSSGERMISDLLVHENVIWIATANAGTYRYRNGQWLQKSGDPETGPGGMVHEMVPGQDGAIWFAFNCAWEYGSVGRMLNGQWTRYGEAQGTLSDSTGALAVAPGGGVHAGFSNSCGSGLGGIGRFTGAGFASFFLDAPAGIPKSMPVHDLKFDAQGTMWAAVYDLLVSFDGTAWRVHIMGPPRGTAMPGAIGTDSDGNTWFGVTSLGAVRFDGLRWRLFTGRDGMGSGTVEKIVSDERGDIWFSMFGQGLGAGVRRYDGQIWYSYSHESGLGSSVVYGMSADGSGNMWFATLHGLARFNGSSWRRFTAADGLRSDRLHDVAAHGDSVWVTYFDNGLGIGHFDGTDWRHYGMDDGLPGNTAGLLATDSKGGVWATVGDYVSHFDGSSWTNTFVPRRYSYRHIRSLYVDGDDNLWVSIWDDVYTGLTLLKDGVWTSITKQDGLPTDQIYQVAPGPLPGQFWMIPDGPPGLADVRIFVGLDERAYLPLLMFKVGNR